MLCCSAVHRQREDGDERDCRVANEQYSTRWRNNEVKLEAIKRQTCLMFERSYCGDGERDTVDIYLVDILIFFYVVDNVSHFLYALNHAYLVKNCFSVGFLVSEWLVY